MARHRQQAPFTPIKTFLVLMKLTWYWKKFLIIFGTDSTANCWVEGDMGTNPPPSSPLPLPLSQLYSARQNQSDMKKAYKIVLAKIWAQKISTQNMCKKCSKSCKNAKNCTRKAKPFLKTCGKKTNISWKKLA